MLSVGDPTYDKSFIIEMDIYVSLPLDRYVPIKNLSSLETTGTSVVITTTEYSRLMHTSHVMFHNFISYPGHCSSHDPYVPEQAFYSRVSSIAGKKLYRWLSSHTFQSRVHELKS